MRNSTLYKNTPRTFRRSSSKIMPEKNKANIGWGSNLQNIEKSMRAIYHPDGFNPKDSKLTEKCKYFLQTGDSSIFTEEELFKLRIMVNSDQAGAEALIVAYDSERGKYRQLFENNIKVHVYVAMILFKEIWPLKMKERGGIELDIETLCDTPIPSLRQNPQFKELDTLIKDSDNWPLTERYYYFAKQTCHSANYGIEWNTFMLNVLEKSGGKVVLIRDQAEYFLKMYRGEFPEIVERCRRVRKQAEDYGIIYNMHGHPYIITNYELDESMYKELYAWGPQSTVGEITRIAFTNLHEHIWNNNLKWDVLQDNHDSYLSQCPLTEVKDLARKKQEFIEQKLVSPVDGTCFRMKSEVQIGFNWGPFDKHNPDKNPLGLREVNWLNN